MNTTSSDPPHLDFQVQEEDARPGTLRSAVKGNSIHLDHHMDLLHPVPDPKEPLPVKDEEE